MVRKLRKLKELMIVVSGISHKLNIIKIVY
jgi:hypothetical protein